MIDIKRPIINFSRNAKILLPSFLALLIAGTVFAAPRAYVNDNANVLDPRTASQLNAVLADLDAKAKAQVAVLTVNSLEGNSLEGYAVETYKKWGIGDKKTDRGVLLLVSVKDRKSRIEVGYGLEGILPDGLTGAIQDKYMLPYFKAGNYAEGITEGAMALAAIIAKDSGITLGQGTARSRRGGPARPMSPGQKILAVLMLVGFVIFAIRHPFLALLLLQSVARGGGGGFGGGGFGGFGGGSSGGGGSSRSW